MKYNFFVFFFAMLPFYINAQCKDCFQEDGKWKFAAGVTLYSNNTYVSDINIMERQPLELNFRYKLGRQHVLRLSLPIPWNVNKSGEPAVSYPRFPTGEIPLDEYLKQLHKQDFTYAVYYKTLHFYESLSGISVGYDFDFPLNKSLSLFAGADAAYYRLAIESKYYSISYDGLDENDKSEIGIISLLNRHDKKKGYVIKPLLGARYQFQKLLMEASVGYAFIKADYFYPGKFSSIDKTGIISSGSTYDEGHYNFKKIGYQFSLYYTF
jgi:hypothetical protein